jgi:hypothetical protein
MAVDPVEFIERKLAMVDAVVKEEAVKVEHLAAVATEDDAPLYVYDDDYHHPVLGDALTVIRLAEATRKLLAMHVPGGDKGDDCLGCCEGMNRYEDLIYDWWPCPTIKILARAYGWTEEP